jgi:dephospho-CoA kinase
MARDGLTQTEAQRRIELHKRLGIGRHTVDFSIDAEADESATRAQVQRLWRRTVQQ